jgi:hypothetical protein
LFLNAVKHTFGKQNEQAITTNSHGSNHFEITVKGIDVQGNGSYAAC